MGIAPQPRAAMTAEEHADATRLVQAGASCLFCAGIHLGASTPACPRLAAGKLNGDGSVVEFTFWAEWDTTRTVFPVDTDDNPADETNGDPRA